MKQKIQGFVKQKIRKAVGEKRVEEYRAVKQRSVNGSRGRMQEKRRKLRWYEKQCITVQSCTNREKAS